MPTDIIQDRTMPRSARLYRPAAPDAIHTQVQTRRASRTRQKPKPYTPDDVTVPVSALTPTRPAASHIWLVYLVIGMLTAMTLLWLGQILWSWGQQISDNLKYGYPRTSQVDRFVGHELGQAPSHFIATNDNGQIYIIEIPGGQPDHSRLLLGPRLVGPGADLAPVTLSFVGAPQHLDLLVTTDGIQVRFHNTGSAYAPI